MYLMSSNILGNIYISYRIRHAGMCVIFPCKQRITVAVAVLGNRKDFPHATMNTKGVWSSPTEYNLFLTLKNTLLQIWYRIWKSLPCFWRWLGHLLRLLDCVLTLGTFWKAQNDSAFPSHGDGSKDKAKNMKFVSSCLLFLACLSPVDFATTIGFMGKVIFIVVVLQTKCLKCLLSSLCYSCYQFARCLLWLWLVLLLSNSCAILFPTRLVVKMSSPWMYLERKSLLGPSTSYTQTLS